MKRFCYDGVLENWKIELALKRSKKFGFRDDELDDVIQELVIILMDIEYDEERANGASEKTMLTSVIDQQLCKMRRSDSRRECLEQSVALSGDETYDNSDLERRSDVEIVVAKMDDQQRRVCELLSQGYSKSVIAEKLDCTWYIIEQIMDDIRTKFEEQGFGEE
ncbi:MAG: hypothetical protein JXM70_07835 [Pirellulales bacterium]|nr:hypothetical protein [Pirellulales bacterium]